MTQMGKLFIKTLPLGLEMLNSCCSVVKYVHEQKYSNIKKVFSNWFIELLNPVHKQQFNTTEYQTTTLLKNVGI